MNTCSNCFKPSQEEICTNCQTIEQSFEQSKQDLIEKLELTVSEWLDTWSKSLNRKALKETITFALADLEESLETPKDLN